MVVSLLALSSFPCASMLGESGILPDERCSTRTKDDETTHTRTKVVDRRTNEASE